MELLDVLCCPVSQEPFGPSGSVRPRILPCGHTISHTTLKSVQLLLAFDRIDTLVAAWLPPQYCRCSASLAPKILEAKAPPLRRICVAVPQEFLRLYFRKACPVQILKQDTDQAHTCPICRTHLTNRSAHTYPTNFAILDILPKILRLQHGGSFTPVPEGTPGLVDGDSDSDSLAQSALNSSGASTPTPPAPTPSLAATAALFPDLQWMQDRVEMPLELADLLPVAQGLDRSLDPRAASQLASKYKLPPEALEFLPDHEDSSQHAGSTVARISPVCPGRLSGAAEGSPAVTILTRPCTLASATHPLPPHLPLQPEVAAAAHAALHLIPDAWPCMQPLIGFRVRASAGAPAQGAGEAERGESGSVPPDGIGNGVAPAALWGQGGEGGEEGVVELAFATLGMPLGEYMEHELLGGWTLPPVDAVEILAQLISMLARLHEQGVTTAAVHALRYSSTFIVGADVGGRIGARWAAWNAPPPAGSERMVALADRMCVPPEDAEGSAPNGLSGGLGYVGVGVGGSPKGDVWRAAAIVVATLAAPRLLGREKRASIPTILSSLQNRLPSHLVIVLKGCLHEDPQLRWTAARAQLHLALISTQAHATSGALDSAWATLLSWSLMLPCPPGRPSATGRSSFASGGSSGRRGGLAVPPVGPTEPDQSLAMDVVLRGAALEAARTYEYPDPLDEIAADISVGERHYGCIMCACLVLCLAPLICLFVFLHILL